MAYFEETLEFDLFDWFVTYEFKIILTLLTVLLIWRFTKRIHRMLGSIYDTMSPHLEVQDQQREATEKLLRWLFYVVALALVMYYWGITPAFYATVIGLSITGLVMGLASRDILANLLAGVVITIEKPFQRGDCIETGEFKGYVVGLTMRSTILQDEQNCEVRIPNSQLINMTLINHSHDKFYPEK